MSLSPEHNLNWFSRSNELETLFGSIPLVGGDDGAGAKHVAPALPDWRLLNAGVEAIDAALEQAFATEKEVDELFCRRPYGRW